MVEFASSGGVWLRKGRAGAIPVARHHTLRDNRAHSGRSGQKALSYNGLPVLRMPPDYPLVLDEPGRHQKFLDSVYSYVPVFPRILSLSFCYSTFSIEPGTHPAQ